MGVLTAPRAEAPLVVEPAPFHAPRPPRAELSSMRGIVIGLLIVLPFWLAIVLSVLRS